ncbi:MAG TPA: glycosyltransferase [Candidatus Bathyarchaeia archaeon]|nr:glycosyltransferase [Candidatus Bathyarchaeia archaeon]
MNLLRKKPSSFDRLRLNNCRVALVYDRVNKWGGAERILLALQKIFPDAPLYTAVCDKQKAPWANKFRVKTSFLQQLPFARRHHEFYPWLTPVAFELLDFSDFDIVITVTSAEAKGIITLPDTLHICYCLTPTRYLWSAYSAYLSCPGFGKLDFLARTSLRTFRPYLLFWDKTAAQRPDLYLTISDNVRRRIVKYYHRDAEVIYPPINLGKFKIRNENLKIQASDFYLIVSRLVAYKRIDLAIKAFNRLKLPLKVVGIGSQLNELKKFAGSNIEFLGYLTEENLLRYYYGCKAVICPQEEDFGLVPLEAQACGKPVISYKKGGALETIIEGETGEFFYPQTVEALMKAVRDSRGKVYSKTKCINNASSFDEQKFLLNFKKIVETKWQEYQKKN